MNLHVAQRIVDATPLLKSVERTECLDRGFSSDEKYVLWEGEEPRYLLRVSDIGQRERRQAEFDILALLRRRGVPCPEPHVFGVTDDVEACYSVLGYLAGISADEALPRLTEHQQFESGIVAGKELRNLHQLRHEDPDFDWPAHRKAKYLRYLKQARELGLGFACQDEVEGYVEANEAILQSAPVRFQHDDYHPANLIINNGKFAGMVDFNRCDWGDPVEDFCKVPWFTTTVSIPFARGQVQGYLSSGVPREFWKRYNLYVAMNISASLVWATSNSTGSPVEWWQRKAEEIVETHDFRDGGPPSWYEV